MLGFHVVRQYEQGIVFRWGKLPTEHPPAGPDVGQPDQLRMIKVNMQINVVGVPAQEAITRDNVTLTVDAVVYFSVVDAVKAIVNVQNYRHAVSQVAQTSLRSVIGHSDMDELLSERERVNAELKDVIDKPTEGPWGVHIERVEVKDIALPDSMKRSMSRQAEAERERRARVISRRRRVPGLREAVAGRPRPWPTPPERCNCGSSRPSSTSPPRKTAPWSCRSRWSCCGSSSTTPTAGRAPMRAPPAARRRRCTWWPSPPTTTA